MTLPQENRVSHFARVNFRTDTRAFGIKRADRLSHIYTIGKTGTGKSTFLETLIRQDIAHAEGLTLIDPHGDLAERVAAAIPPERQKDLVYFNVSDPRQPYGYNPLKRVSPEWRPLAAAGMLEVFETSWDKRSWGVRMEHILRNALLALLDQPKATLHDILHLLSDRDFRKAALAHIENPQVRAFWQDEYERYSYRLRADAIAPIQNKVGAFLADPRLYRVLVEPEETLSIRPLMDEGKILLVNLARGRLGADSAALLGGLLVTTIGLAAFSRADLPATERTPHWLYVDEFQSFTTLSLATMLSELRKFGVGMTLAHQYLDQLREDIRHAVLGNAGTLIAFRLGAKDAGFVARELAPKFEANDLLALPNHHIYLKLLIDGTPSQPFSAVTLPPWEIMAGTRAAA